MNKVVITLIVLVILGGAAWSLSSKPVAPQPDNVDLGTVPAPYATSTDPYSTSTTVGGSTQQGGSTSVNTSVKNLMHKITIETNLGTIQFETYDADAPKTVENFVTLAKKGFYDGVIFHRVIDGFMIQGGDPTGTGMGGPGYKFDDELNPATQSYKNGYKTGVVAMANAGPNTNGSQFFIMLQDYPLPNNYTIFGKVVAGQDVVSKIGKTETDANDRPVSQVTMKKVTVEEVK